MAKKNVIVRNLPSVETLGCTSVICSDKTGTLTTNNMSVSKIFVLSETAPVVYDVEGITYEPVGQIFEGQNSIDFSNHDIFGEFAAICSLCNNSCISFNNDTGVYDKVGEATEAALITLVEKLNPSICGDKRALPVHSEIISKWTKDFTLDFSRDRKSMSVYVRHIDNPESPKIFCKGAPENVLSRCKYYRVGTKRFELTEDMAQTIRNSITEWSTNLRCLALATVDKAMDVSDMNLTEFTGFDKYESNMTFVGCVGMLDPPRHGVYDAIQTCHGAGIRVIVITGDNKNTAESICRLIGIFGPDESTEGISYTGAEFNALSSEEQRSAVLRARLFSRVEPLHKFHIVQHLRANGEISAMTGDGVNDVSALKAADIGIAMGSGTEVAKGASDMVLADDNFNTIISAVEEGRSIYNNTKQFIRYLISSNIGEVVSIFLTSALGYPEALIPVQLLWVNLITDGLPATALSFNPSDPDILKKKPRNPREALISFGLMLRYVIIGVYVGVATTVSTYWWYSIYQYGPRVDYYQLTHHLQCATNPGRFTVSDCSIFQSDEAQGMALSVLVVIEMLNALNSLSENQSLLVVFPWKNLYLILSIILSLALHFCILHTPFFAKVFQVSPLNLEQWSFVFVVSFPVLLIDESLKFWERGFVLKDFLILIGAWGVYASFAFMFMGII